MDFMGPKLDEPGLQDNRNVAGSGYPKPGGRHSLSVARTRNRWWHLAPRHREKQIRIPVAIPWEGAMIRRSVRSLAAFEAWKIFR